jgi:hypothetical protein
MRLRIASFFLAFFLAQLASSVSALISNIFQSGIALEIKLCA